ncbi:MAG: hypothetical protein JST06_09430 [Bacteroidetes bacterium]|nr:hypothetical protein [Bacteroidota bacterium]MBS1629113.1 hypothetical protein [Bacteroidota bacterium]
MKLRFSIWLLLLASLNACSKYEHSYRSVDPAAKAHIDWRPGSYWIMQDSASGALDSFYVSSYKEGTFYGSDERSNETISITVKERGLPLATDTTQWGFSVGYSGDPVNIVFYCYMLNQKKTATGINAYIFLSGTELDTFVADGKRYQKVYYTTMVDAYPNPNYYLNVGMQDTDGFVYIKLLSQNFSHTWFLIRNKIVRGL